MRVPRGGPMSELPPPNQPPIAAPGPNPGRRKAPAHEGRRAARLFKAAVKAGVDVRLEFRPDGTIIAIAHKSAEVDGADALSSDAPEEIRKLI
jgi:hypothetical protein